MNGVIKVAVVVGEQVFSLLLELHTLLMDGFTKMAEVLAPRFMLCSQAETTK